MLQKNKLSRNQTGFSLIELMVAVAILALVAIGLFQAFSVAFQSMSDSKDRTVATNYAQQILEDYKNTPFEKIRPFSGPIEGTKYFQNVSFQMVNENLKKVIAQIVWGGRNDKNKNIIVDTLIGNTQTTTTTEAGAIPAGIIIYADRYNLLPGTDDRVEPSHIYTEIVDKSGDIITDWDESNIYFEIESVIDLEGESKDISYLGNLRNYSVPPVKGIAETYFDQYEGKEREGFVKIKATLTVGEIKLYDVLTLKVTNDAVAIILTADKDKISTKGGEEGIVHLTARIVDAGDDTVNTDREISFTIVSGPGSLENMVNTSQGVAYVDLIAGTISGTATIIATSTLLEPAVIDIQIVDPGKNNVKVEAADLTIAQKDSTEITAYLIDYLGNAVSGETINFSIDNINLGYLSPESLTTDSNGEAVVTLTLNYAGTVKVTASWIAGDGTEVFDIVSVSCRSHNLYVWSEPITITEGGSATIYAELKDFNGDYVVSETINFSISQDNCYFENNEKTISSFTDISGIAFAILTINTCSAENGITTVLANWLYDPEEVLGDVDIICTNAPIYQVDISADKTTISAGETVNITATLTKNGDLTSGIEVTFSLNDYTNAKLDGSSSPVTKSTDGDGKATVVLSDLPAGDSVIVTAEAGGDSDSITISCEKPEITIELIDHSQKHGAGSDGKKQVYFNINVLNSNIDLKQMKIVWQSSEKDSEDSERLNDLLINDTKVYSHDPGAVNGTVITFNQSIYFTLEKNKTYEIKMIFNKEVEKKNWTITFINPETEIEIKPSITFHLN
ncbi:MAG TPA: hypothetical protein DEG96_08025 [Candidatus Atribacteria bacterium]|nr:hypothetical protein [Candidatus Atribacteria bacterium]